MIFIWAVVSWAMYDGLNIVAVTLSGTHTPDDCLPYDEHDGAYACWQFQVQVRLSPMIQELFKHPFVTHDFEHVYHMLIATRKEKAIQIAERLKTDLRTEAARLLWESCQSVYDELDCLA